MASVRSPRWEDACTAAAILAVDPVGIGGVSLRSPAGPIRDRWLANCMQLFPGESHWRRVPLNVADNRLLGGLDLSATLRAGRPIAERGILACADGGILVLSTAERLSPGVAAKISCVLDRHELVLEREGFARRVNTRFAVIALDEGIDSDEQPPQSLLERLALHVDLNGIALSATASAPYSWSDIANARKQLAQTRASDDVLFALCEVGAAVGVDSVRVAWLAFRVARAVAALSGRQEVSEEDAALAGRLVFAPRAVTAPPPADRNAAEPNASDPNAADRNEESSAAGRGASDKPSVEPPHGAPGGMSADTRPEPAHSQRTPPPADTRTQDADLPTAGQCPAAEHAHSTLGERVLEATKSTLPAHFLSQMSLAGARNGRSTQTGRSGSEQLSKSGGRPAGTSAGEPRAGARVNVIETLRAAAPWQRLRAEAAIRAEAASPRRAPHIRILKEDIRITRYVRRARSTTIFLVDASGSAALHRLAEVKGAVELMLAESYVRRDRVALISFRGTSARILLPPTNSLVRAKRELASLPGGGGTPLALGLDTARALADALKRRGESPVVVVLTDGRPNISRDGRGNRTKAEADTVSAARMLRGSSIASLMVDTAPQPRMLTEQFAREMGARYVPLPYADAGSLAAVVHECGPRGTRYRHVHA